MSDQSTSAPLWLPGVLDGVYRAVRRVAVDPRTAEVAGAPLRAAAFLVRTWSRNRGPADPDRYLPARLSAGLAAQVLLDEVMISALKNPALFPHGADYAAAAADLRVAHDLYERGGWLEDPASYHREPSAPDWRTVQRQRALDVVYEHVSFPSGFEPRPGEPGRERWLAHEANSDVHAWMLRHRGGPRPWLVCIHGFGMGRPFTDLRAFRARRLYDMGLNLLLPVLPLHGPRATTKVRGEGFMSINLIDSVHGLTQSAWDVRRAIRWVRDEHGAPGVGLYGLSLGSYVATLVASLHEGLDCVVAGIPAVDVPELYRRHSPPGVRRLAERAGALGEAASTAHRVVSPLALSPRLPVERRFVFAGLGDRMSTFGQAHRLWLHWQRPRLAQYDGGHVGFFFSGPVSRFETDALADSGLMP